MYSFCACLPQMAVTLGASVADTTFLLEILNDLRIVKRFNGQNITNNQRLKCEQSWTHRTKDTNIVPRTQYGCILKM